MDLYEEHEYLKEKLEFYQDALKNNYKLRMELENSTEESLECST